MINCIQIQAHDGDIRGEVELPASKSISNRLLLMAALANQVMDWEVQSTADDILLMSESLSQSRDEYNAGEAGTVARFLTAYFCLQKGTQRLTGSPRLCQRPLQPLINALCELGADIRYLGEPGHLPIEIGETQSWKRNTSIVGDVSSQFISALLMIAPMLPKGLQLKVETSMASRSYIDMTIALMKSWGIKVIEDGQSFSIEPQSYQMPSEVVVEADWSAAAYFYGLVALADTADLYLPRLSLDSLQGDRVAAKLFKHWGVLTIEEEAGIRLIKSVAVAPHSFSHDFSSCPDLAQTVLVCSALSGVAAVARGISSLRLKETDRIKALQKELQQLGATLAPKQDEETYSLYPNSFYKPDIPLQFNTYNDHRMAMSFSLCAMRFPTDICDPQVVSKSFPTYWSCLQALNFNIKF